MLHQESFQDGTPLTGNYDLVLHHPRGPNLFGDGWTQGPSAEEKPPPSVPTTPTKTTGTRKDSPSRGPSPSPPRWTPRHPNSPGGVVSLPPPSCPPVQWTAGHSPSPHTTRTDRLWLKLFQKETHVPRGVDFLVCGPLRWSRGHGTSHLDGRLPRPRTVSNRDGPGLGPELGGVSASPPPRT